MYARVKLSWNASVSTDIQSRKLIITKSDGETVLELGPEVTSYELNVAASSGLSFRTIVTDSEGNEVSSDSYSFVLGDLVAPQPDTALFHEVVEVVDGDIPAVVDPVV